MQGTGARKAGQITLNNMGAGEQSFRASAKSIATNYQVLERVGAQDAILVRTTEEILAAKKEGKAAVFFGTQNGSPIEREIGFLRILWHLGIRIFGLDYNVRNLIADRLMEPAVTGLSKFGVQAVEELNRLHMMVDVSHVRRKSSMDALEVSRDPIVFSHSNARAIYDHPRNIDEEQIKVLAEKDGVIGITGFGPAGELLKSETDVPTLDDFLDHLDYMVNVAGVDHVGIGLDIGEGRTRKEVERFKSGVNSSPGTEGVARSGKYEYGFDSWYVRELRGPHGPMNRWLIAVGLLQPGCSDQDILKILGGNVLRVYKHVWRK